MQKNEWIIRGLVWGALMYITMIFILPLTGLIEEPDYRMKLINIPIWAVGGLIFGLVTRRLIKQKVQK